LNSNKIIFKNESYQIVGKCYDVFNHLGPGFLEILYKDALEYEFGKAGIKFERERKYCVKYKNIILPHHFYADFVVDDKIILEVKSVSSMPDEFIARCINYLKVSGNRLALLVNFGQVELKYMRIVV
jgi:GxxExxY protein